ncbi:MAG TPA: HEAT repeat domain-containing protein [Polyangiales bacterium]|nr:HEAT repeat domain-containing protein [Polyangiales bacterium]
MDAGANPAVRAEILKTAQAKLQNGDEAAVRQAFSSLVELGGDEAAQAVVTRLHRGLPPQLIEAAIDTLVLLNRPSLAPPLLELTQHRRIQVRIKAMQALAILKVKSAQSALLYALDDPSSEVRSAAVEALASVGNARALPALYTSAERGVPGAWQAIGQIASPADFKSLMARAQKDDVMMVRPALDALMLRANVPLDAKLKLVQQVGALGSPSARAALVEWNAAYKAEGHPRLRQSLADGLIKFDREHPQPKFEPPAAKPAAPPAPATKPRAQLKAAGEAALAEAR